MALVGQFPGWREQHRRTNRAPVNPLDKSTVVSIYPRDIHEVKHTLQPGVWDLMAGTLEKPATLVVGPSSWWKELDEEQPLLEIPVSSVLIAESIVTDWAKGLIGCDMAEAIPGVFYIPGEYTVERLRKEHPRMLENANRKQKNWYLNLVKMADIMWARTNGNPLSISDDARLAAKSLNLNDKPWLQDFKTVELINCKACGSLVNPLYPVCANCKAIVNEAKANELGIKFTAL